MANTILPKSRSKFLTGDLDWTSGTWKVAYLDGTYTYDDAHEFADVFTSAIIASANLTGRTVLDGGVADADDEATMVIPIGETAEAVVIWLDTGDASTSPFVYFADESDDDLPIAIAGAGAIVPLLWENSPDRVFRL